MEIDAIILSRTASLSYFGMLSRTVNTLRDCNEGIKINVIVVESNENAAKKEYLVPGVTTIFPQESYNYNKFLNIALAKSSNEHVLICNNDIIFRKNSVINLLSIMNQHELDSCCPVEPNYHFNHGYLSKEDFKRDYILGYRVQREVVGWCIGTKRSLIEEMGGFDERFLHWYQDDDYAMWLKVHGKRHGLVPSSRVYHMFQRSMRLIEDRNLLTNDLYQIFVNKWAPYAYQNQTP